MREIKFRAFHKKEKKMYYSDEASSLHYFIEFTTKEPFYGELLQYTGLKDKNGKEIYEGDIIKHKSGCFRKDTTGIVNWGYSQYEVIRQVPDKESTDYFSWDGIDLNETEVIGNIYEHQELLKEKGEK